MGDSMLGPQEQGGTPEDPAPPASAGDQPAGQDGSSPPGLTRRRLLALAGAGGLVGAGYVATRAWFDDEDPSPFAGGTRTASTATASTTAATEQPAQPVEQLARWSDPATWAGAVPGEGDVAVIDRGVMLDIDTRVAGVQIEPTGALVFDPARSRRLESHGNAIVRGVLRLRPDSQGIVHSLVFVGVDEGRFVGDHTEVPLDTDIGLWTIEGGVVDAQGAPKTAWTHLAGAVDKGATTVTVDEASGWQVGDEIVITPTEPATVDEHWLHHDRRSIAAIDGNRVTLAEPLAYPHPVVTVREDVTHRAEVLNLTRNVRIEGTPEGRAHVIFLRAQEPQKLGYLSLRHLGPRQGDEGVLSRYSLHFHMCGDGSRGTEIEGLVAFEGGNHAFVSHLSHGLTLRQCIVHDNVDDPFWWDLGPRGEGRDSVPTHEIIYDRCVAHLVHAGNNPYSLSGFMLGAGEGNVARGCVAVAVEGRAESSSGFHWPSHSRDDNSWTFEDDLAHNNRNTGIYYWQNNAPRTIVDRFTAYHCNRGIFAGSYTNLVSYRENTIYACTEAGLVINAVPSRAKKGSSETITYERMYVDQAGLTDFAVDITKHLVDSGRTTIIEGCTFKGGRQAQVGLPTGGKNAQVYDFVDCTFEGNAFWLADDLPRDAQIRVQDAQHGSIMLGPIGTPGETRREWNASVTEI